MAINIVEQARQLENPDARLAMEESGAIAHFWKHMASGVQGIATGDYACFGRKFWESISAIDETLWVFQQSTVDENIHFGGQEHVLLWEDGIGKLACSDAARIQGVNAWNQWGIAVSQM